MDIPSNGAANCLLLHKKAGHQAPPGATPSKRTSARAQLKPQEPRNSKRGRAICGTVRERNHDIPRCITRRRQPNAERPRPLRPPRARAPAGAHPNTHSKNATRNRPRTQHDTALQHAAPPAQRRAPAPTPPAAPPAGVQHEARATAAGGAARRLQGQATAPLSRVLQGSKLCAWLCLPDPVTRHSHGIR